MVSLGLTSGDLLQCLVMMTLAIYSFFAALNIGLSDKVDVLL
ncbi:hypothetical protein IFVP22_C1310005 [Vibrio parahaemolyticus]